VKIVANMHRYAAYDNKH